MREISMKVLVTGAGGFLGSHIVEESLRLGHETHVIIRGSSPSSFLKTLGSRITIHQGDLRDALKVQKALEGLDLVIHSAGRVTDFGAYETFYQDNVVATETLLHACHKEGVGEFVFISSPSIFAEEKDHLNADESLPYPFQYMNFYAKTKSLSEQLVLRSDSESLRTVSLRPRGIWGERDYNGFFPKLLKALIQGKLKRFAGDKKVIASLCHARNIAMASFEAAKHWDKTHGQAYFITDGEDVAVYDLIDQIAGKLVISGIKGDVNPKVLHLATQVIEMLWKLPTLHERYSPPISRYALGMLSYHTSYSCAKATRDFGYHPTHTMSRNLDELLNWIEKEGGLSSYLKLNEA